MHRRGLQLDATPPLLLNMPQQQEQTQETLCAAVPCAQAAATPLAVPLQPLAATHDRATARVKSSPLLEHHDRPCHLRVGYQCSHCNQFVGSVPRTHYEGCRGSMAETVGTLELGTMLS